MKTLLSGHHNPHFPTITEYIEAAIRNVGHELVIFEDRQHTIPGRIRKLFPILNRFDLKTINRRMLLLAQETKLDVAIVTGGHRVFPETVKSLRDRGVVCILWTIDPPLNFRPILNVAPFYDQIFCQGTEGIELLEGAGIRGARWLPMACDPDWHYPLECSPFERESYGSDVVFVGSYYPERAKLFERLSGLDLAIWGPGWDSLNGHSPLHRCIRGAHTMPGEWLKIYSASKIVLATHYQDPQGRFPVYQASPRVFEALACGAFVICDRQRDVFSLFEEGTHLVSFHDSDDLVEKVKYYLEHPAERSAIAARGRTECLAKHTYVHRIQDLLSIIAGHA